MKAPISVIITVYNDYEYLTQAINSVLTQTLLPSEIIIVDDGSKEYGAESIAKNFISNDKNIDILFFRKENGGASSARNFGWNIASQELIAFLDVDDKMLPNNLKDKYEIIKNLGENYFGVFCNTIRSTGKTDIFSDIDGVINTNLIDKELIGIPGGIVTYLLRKKDLIEIGGFDEEIKCNEDYDTLIRLLKNNKRCRSSNTISYYINIRENSLSRNKNHIITFKRVMNFLDKAEKFNYYDVDFLNQRKKETYMLKVRFFLIKKEFINAFFTARKAFSYSKPITLNQKILYIVSLSFLNHKNEK